MRKLFSILLILFAGIVCYHSIHIKETSLFSSSDFSANGVQETSEHSLKDNFFYQNLLSRSQNSTIDIDLSEEDNNRENAKKRTDFISSFYTSEYSEQLFSFLCSKQLLEGCKIKYQSLFSRRYILNRTIRI